MSIHKQYPDNMLYKSFTAQTIDDTPVTTCSLPVAEGEIYKISMRIIALSTDGTERGGFEKKLVVYREIDEDIAIQGSIVTAYKETSDPVIDTDCVPNVTTQAMELVIEGKSGYTFNWAIVAEIVYM